MITATKTKNETIAAANPALSELLGEDQEPKPEGTGVTVNVDTNTGLVTVTGVLPFLGKKDFYPGKGGRPGQHRLTLCNAQDGLGGRKLAIADKVSFNGQEAGGEVKFELRCVTYRNEEK